MFGSIGMQELIIIFVIALIIFGKLPELGHPLGKAWRVQAGVERPAPRREEIRIDEQRAAQCPIRLP
jgi:Sec-independent protein translocase protein TatA